MPVTYSSTVTFTLTIQPAACKCLPTDTDPCFETPHSNSNKIIKHDKSNGVFTDLTYCRNLFCVSEDYYDISGTQMKNVITK